MITYPNIAEEDNYTKRVQVDRLQRSKVRVPGQEMPWQEVPETTDKLPAEWEPLFDMQELENVESVEVGEEKNLEKYIVSLKDVHGEKVMQENVEALQENIEFLEENNMPEEMVQGLEARIQEIEQTNFSDFIYTYIVDNQGHGVEVDFEYKVTNPDNTAFTNNSTYTLIDYKLSDTTDFMPSLK